jgi:cysteine desulfurase
LPAHGLYLDHNATTPLDPEVAAAMRDALSATVGNPSSMHQEGQAARRLVDRARQQVAAFLNVETADIVFTGGGTEADNLAILGAARALPPERRTVVTTAVEHHAVLSPCERLREEGHPVVVLPVDGEGRLREAALAASAGPGVGLYSVMTANNDTGVVFPLATVVATAKSCGALVHTDAVQAAGRLPLDARALGVDLLSLSAHKLGGPKGVGALYARRGVSLVPLAFGGKQEKSLRPGTENLPGIVGLGHACALAAARLAADRVHLRALRDAFEARILARVPGARVNGGGERLPNTANLAFAGLDGEAILVNLDLLGVSVSLGAACSSASKEPSHVLLAMGQSEAVARSSVRFSFGRAHTLDDVERAVAAVTSVVSLLGGAVHG